MEILNTLIYYYAYIVLNCDVKMYWEQYEIPYCTNKKTRDWKCWQQLVILTHRLHLPEDNIDKNHAHWCQEKWVVLYLVQEVLISPINMMKSYIKRHRFKSNSYFLCKTPLRGFHRVWEGYHNWEEFLRSYSLNRFFNFSIRWYSISQICLNTDV